MKNDPAIQRTRDARQQISSGLHHDPAKVVAYYIEMQERFGTRLRPIPKQAAPAPANPEHGTRVLAEAPITD